MPIHPAPGELELVREFVNSVDVEEGTDELDTPDGLGRWLAAHDLGGGATLSERDRERAVELRGAIRALLLANGGEPLERNAVAALNRAGDDARLRVRFDEEGGSELAPAAGGIDAALARILAIVHRSMAEGTWPRLKACREDTCQWAFYDRSRNRSGAWCSMEVCGNRAKARAFRERHA